MNKLILSLGLMIAFIASAHAQVAVEKESKEKAKTEQTVKTTQSNAAKAAAISSEKQAQSAEKQAEVKTRVAGKQAENAAKQAEVKEKAVEKEVRRNASDVDKQLKFESAKANADNTSERALQTVFSSDKQVKEGVYSKEEAIKIMSDKKIPTNKKLRIATESARRNLGIKTAE